MALIESFIIQDMKLGQYFKMLGWPLSQAQILTILSFTSPNLHGYETCLKNTQFQPLIYQFSFIYLIVGSRYFYQAIIYTQLIYRVWWRRCDFLRKVGALPYNYQIKMNLPAHTKKNTYNIPLSIPILDLPPSTQLFSATSPGKDFNIVYFSRKKVTLAVYNTEISRPKLFPNLEIFEWREQTDFPILKTYFVSIGDQKSPSSHLLRLQVFCEYCPLRLSSIHQIALGQAFYILKECIVGFQRLISKFGGFHISDNMIAFNEKGCCKVWMNENFSLNTPQNGGCTEQQMIQKIVNEIQKHTTDTKSSRKLFLLLKSSTSFLAALKTIEAFSANSQTVVPNRFFPIKLPTQSIKGERNILGSNSKKNLNGFLNSVRFSVKSRKYCTKEENSQSRASIKKQSASPSHIRRFKSEDKIFGFLKNSDQKTTDSKNHADPKLSTNFGSQPNENSFLEPPFRSSKSQRNVKWIEESSFGVDEETPTKYKKDRKQMSHSQAFIVPHSKTNAVRKFSINYENSKLIKGSPVRRFKQIHHQQNNHASLREMKKLDQQSERFDQEICEESERMQEHSDKVIKNNGWTSNFNGLLNTPQELGKSIHAGQEENIALRDFKLEKLSRLGRREVTMSILPEEHEDGN